MREITIYIKAIDEASEKIEALSNKIAGLSLAISPKVKKIEQVFKAPTQSVGNLEESLKEVGLTQKEFFKEMPFWEDIGTGLYNKLTQQTISYGRAVEIAYKKSRRFKFEWLSILFTGYALERAFRGVVQSQLELYGVSDAMTSFWDVTMAPVMERVSNILIDMINNLSDSGDSFKNIIGSGVLLFHVFGKIIGVVATFILTVSGIANLLGVTFGTALKIVIGFVGKIIAIIGAIWNIVSGVIDLIKGKYEGLGKIIIGIGLVIFAFISSTIGAIVVAVGTAVYLIIKYWEPIKSFFLSLWEWLKEGWDSFVKVFNSIIKKIANIFIGLGNIVVNVWNFIIKLFEDGLNGIIKIIRKTISNINKLGIVKIPMVPFVSFEGITFGKIPYLQEGGEVLKTGVAVVHKGEVVSKSGREIVLNVTYNINVSDKYEMEKLIRLNNYRLVEDIKRQIAT